MRTLTCLLIATGITPLWALDNYKPAAETARPILGVEMTPTPTSVQEQMGLAPNQGVLVQSVYDGTAAQNMGLQTGDVVLAVNGSAITSMSDLRNEVALNQVGDPVEVTIQRGNQQSSATGTFQPWPASIPYEPIDPEAEKRFHDWQERRLERTRDEMADLRKQVATYANQLGVDKPGDWAEGDAPDAAIAEGGDRQPMTAFPWHFQYVVKQTFVPITRVESPAIVSAVLPWHVDWRAASDLPKTQEPL